MSTPAVMMRTRSFLFTGIANLMSALPEGRRRDGPANQACQRDDREDVRDHGYELRGNGAGSLQVDLHRFRRREQEASGPGADGLPAAEDHRGQGDEAAAGGHLVRELMLIERKECPAQSGEDAGCDDGHGANATHGYADRGCGLGMLARGAQSQSKSRPIDQSRYTKNGQESEKFEQSSRATGDARRIRRAAEGDAYRKPRRPDREDIDRNAGHDLVRAISNRRHGMNACGHRSA